MHAVAAFFASIITFVSGFFAPTVASNSPVDVRMTQPAAASAAAQTEIVSDPFNDPAAALAVAATSPVEPTPVPSSPPQQTIINQPVIERIIERIVSQGAATVSTQTLAAILADFEQSISSRIAALNPPKAAIPEQVAAAGNVTGAFFPASQRIDQLTNTAINNPTITGGSITAASIIGTISNAINAASAVVANLSGTELSYTRATFTNATSTNFAAINLTATGAVFTNATTTNLAVTNLTASATSTLSGLTLSLVDCSAYGNGGKLTTDASGNVSCAADQGGAGGTVGGLNTQVQFNDGGIFGGNAAFTFDKTAGRLTITNASTTNITASYASSTIAAVGSLSLGTPLSAGSGGTGVSNPTAAGVLVGSYAGGSWQQLATSSLGLLTTNVAEGSNLYFTNARTDARINATSTIATLTSAPNLATVATSLSGFLKATAGALATSLIDLASDVTGVLPVGKGGTGWAAIAAGAIPYGNGSGAVGTTSAGTAGQVLALLNGVPTWTATTTFSAPLSYSNGAVSVTQANGSTNGYLTSGDWTLFNNKISSSSLSATYPLSYNSSTGVFSSEFSTTTTNSFNALQQFSAGATSSALTVSGSAWLSGVIGSRLLGLDANSQIVATTTIGTNLLAGVLATINGTTLSAGGSITVASSTLLADSNTFSGSNIFISPLALSSTSGTTTIASGQGFTIGGSQFVLQQGSGNIGIGSTTPFARLSVTGADQSASTKGVIITDSLATELLTVFNNGLVKLQNLLATASSTIGNGTQAGGLTINGGATTTGYLVVQGSSTSTFTGGVQASALNITSTSATSTFANGISLNGGCFKFGSGTCLGPNAGVTLTQVIASSSPGSNTSFTVPNNTAYIIVRVWGAGGGGSGGGNSTATGGSAGGTSCFGVNSTSSTCTGTNVVNATGGGGGIISSAGGSGGVGSGGDINLTGAAGGGSAANGVATTFTATGMSGGSAPLGGGGATDGFNADGGTGAAFGGGGAGGAVYQGPNLNYFNGSGGGGGGYTEKTITNPTGTYYYTIGSGGAGGTAGASGYAGGAGGAGGITIYVYTTSQLTSSGAGVTLTRVISQTSGTNVSYTPPSNISYIEVEVWGGGGGGSGGGTNGATNGNNGNQSCFSNSSTSTACSGVTGPILFATGGTGGVWAGTASSGGTGSGGDINLSGAGTEGPNTTSGTNYMSGSTGGSAPLGGGGGKSDYGGGGGAGSAFGGGGGGGGMNGAVGAGYVTGNGGGGGGYSRKVITAPSGTYYYTVGTGGTAGAAGSGGTNGGAGGAGGIVIKEYTTGAATAGSVGSGTAGQFPFYNALGSNLTATSSIFINTVNGFIGIGTTTPWTKLEITDSSAASTTPFSISNFGSATSSTKVSLAFRTDDIVHNTGTTTASIFSVFMGGTSGVPQTANGDLAFATLRSGTLTEAARLTSAGNLGIGTTTPDTTLHIVKNSGIPMIVGGSHADSGVISFQNTSAGGRTYNVGSTGSGSGAGNGFSIYDVASTTSRLLISPSGHMGIGVTPNSANQLYVVGESSVDFAMYANPTKATGAGVVGVSQNGSNAGYLGWSNNWGVYCFGVQCGGNVAWTNNSDARLKTAIQDIDASSTLASLMRLRPVTYHWKDAGVDAGRGEQLGFIAQEVEPLFPDLVTKGASTTITLADGSKETISDPIALDYSGFVVPLVKAVQEIASIGSTFKANLIAWLGDAGNGIEKLFAHVGNFDTTNTHQLCISDSTSDNAPLCVTKSQLAALLSSQSVSSASASTTQSSTSQEPVIELNGNASSTIQVSDTYNDLGARIVAPESDLNLGIVILLDGATTTAVSIDTTTPGEHTILYTVTSPTTGLTGSIMRTIIISPAELSPAPAEDTNPFNSQPANDNASSTPAVDTAA